MGDQAMSRIVMMNKHGTHGNCGRVIVERLINFAYNIHEHDEVCKKQVHVCGESV